MNDKDRIAELEKQLQEAVTVKPLNIKIGNKQNVVVGGPALGQRFPVTLYAPSWLVLLEQKDDILQFIEDHRDELTWGK